jgi:hypothetical protein
VTQEEIRGTCNRLIVSGIDTINSYYSFAGLSDAQLRGLNEWVGRCCSSLKGGCQVADLAVLYPTESVWPRFIPSRHYAGDSPSAAQVENLYHAVSEDLYAAGRDFTYVDGRALVEAKVEDDVLAHGRLRWRVVILPGADTLPLAAWENLSRFVRSGGVLVAVGALPANSETEFPSARVQAIAAEIFGPVAGATRPQAWGNSAGGGGIFLPAGSTALLPPILSTILEPDVKVKAAGVGSPLRATHRRIGGREVYFLINDGDQPWAGQVRLSVDGPGEQCDPATGQITPLPQANAVALDLPGYGGVLFRFPAARLPQRFPVRNDVLPSLDLRELPEVPPQVGRGEFVREELTKETSAEDRSRPAWRASATLTKGNVDTFLFLSFPCALPRDLQGPDCLVLDTWVPPGQRTPTQLLVILHEKNGADYLANTGRALGAPGQEQTCVSLNRFQLAGWSSGQQGHLDLARVTEIRIGWGGYLGAEGEKIDFTLAQPRTARAR